MWTFYLFKLIRINYAPAANQHPWKLWMNRFSLWMKTNQLTITIFRTVYLKKRRFDLIWIEKKEVSNCFVLHKCGLPKDSRYWLNVWWKHHHWIWVFLHKTAYEQILQNFCSIITHAKLNYFYNSPLNQYKLTKNTILFTFLQAFYVHALYRRIRRSK